MKPAYLQMDSLKWFEKLVKENRGPRKPEITRCGNSLKRFETSRMKKLSIYNMYKKWTNLIKTKGRSIPVPKMSMHCIVPGITFYPCKLQAVFYATCAEDMIAGKCSLEWVPGTFVTESETKQPSSPSQTFASGKRPTLRKNKERPKQYNETTYRHYCFLPLEPATKILTRNGKVCFRLNSNT